MAVSHLFKKKQKQLQQQQQHWNLDIIGYLVLAKFRGTWNLALVLQILQKIRENYCNLMSFVSKDILKNAPCLMC